MELGTFGAIMRFAIELEQQAVAFYESGMSGDTESVFQSLARQSRKRARRLERARRESISEMILESIVGLEPENYTTDVDPDLDRDARLDQGVALEEAQARFYREAAEKIPMLGVVRLFRRMAEENERRRERLEEA